MKKFLIFLFVVLVFAGAAFAKDYEVNKKAGSFDVEVRIDKNPSVVGDNKVTIEIKDALGKFVSDANVELYYFMPSMPSMNYTEDARLEGNVYNATIKPTMGGDWSLDVKFTRPDKKVHKVTFSFNAE